jgi:hypothetical protein
MTGESDFGCQRKQTCLSSLSPPSGPATYRVYYPLGTGGLPYNSFSSNVDTSQDERLQALTAGAINSIIFWDMTPRSPLKVNQRLGETYRPRGWCRTERGGETFVRNVGRLSTGHTVLDSR